VGSFAAALGPAALFFFLPMRVVGCGGGSYLGFSFCGRCQQRRPLTDITAGIILETYLLFLALVISRGSAAASRRRLVVTLCVFSMLPCGFRRGDLTMTHDQGIKGGSSAV
jgi:hypothetical protein